eukprot:TRINITY_DN1556_c0_g2_i3.p1 TRINITY_DN1556_c0_g2~~TRINITY_DN1556_c0_g2_i3.p1  ORF type:complete len:322 (+),score=118.83 TRINITY_DN1556_c0_g2_i3:590-1555(+)
MISSQTLAIGVLLVLAVICAREALLRKRYLTHIARFDEQMQRLRPKESADALGVVAAVDNADVVAPIATAAKVVAAAGDVARTAATRSFATGRTALVWQLDRLSHAYVELACVSVIGVRQLWADVDSSIAPPTLRALLGPNDAGADDRALVDKLKQCGFETKRDEIASIASWTEFSFVALVSGSTFFLGAAPLNLLFAAPGIDALLVPPLDSAAVAFRPSDALAAKLRAAGDEWRAELLQLPNVPLGKCQHHAACGDTPREQMRLLSFGPESHCPWPTECAEPTTGPCRFAHQRYWLVRASIDGRKSCEESSYPPLVVKTD